jgi:hypothetical protein
MIRFSGLSDSNVAPLPHASEFCNTFRPKADIDQRMSTNLDSRWRTAPPMWSHIVFIGTSGAGFEEPSPGRLLLSALCREARHHPIQEGAPGRRPRCPERIKHSRVQRNPGCNKCTAMQAPCSAVGSPLALSQSRSIHCKTTVGGSPRQRPNACMHHVNSSRDARRFVRSS